MLQQIETIKYHAEIYQLMTPTINTFYETKNFSKNSSQTARMYVIKNYI
jgi:thymidine kinase